MGFSQGSGGRPKRKLPVLVGTPGALDRRFHMKSNLFTSNAFAIHENH
jgi:hypothetical protein